MGKITLSAEKRSELRKANQGLRASGNLPAIIYGHGFEPIMLKLAGRDAEKIYRKAGSNRIVNLEVDGQSHNVLFHDVQRDARTGALTHADFYAVKMDEEITTEVPLHFTGESVAVYQQEGTLVRNLETLEIEALPANLPERIDVDISVLDDFDKEIRVSDLVVPSNVKVLEDGETLVAKVDPPRSEEEMAELDAEIVEELPEGAAEEGAEAVAGEAEGGADKPSAGDKADKPSE